MAGFVLAPEGGGGMAGLFAHVAMASEVLQQLDLAQCALGEDLLAEDIGDLLDGDALVGLVVHGGAVWGKKGPALATRRELAMEG